MLSPALGQGLCNSSRETFGGGRFINGEEWLRRGHRDGLGLGGGGRILMRIRGGSGGGGGGGADASVGIRVTTGCVD